MLVSVLSVMLAGCGGEADPHVGTWNAIGANMGDIEVDVAEVFPDGLDLVLDDNGRGSLVIEGQDNIINWTNEDGLITISDQSGTATGGMEGDLLVLRNFAGSGVDFTFQRTD